MTDDDKPTLSVVPDIEGRDLTVEISDEHDELVAGNIERLQRMHAEFGVLPNSVLFIEARLEALIDSLYPGTTTQRRKYEAMSEEAIRERLDYILEEAARQAAGAGE